MRILSTRKLSPRKVADELSPGFAQPPVSPSGPGGPGSAQGPRADQLEATRQIVEAVRLRGDEAVAEFTRKFDWPGARRDNLRTPRSQMQAALKSLGTAQRRALEAAIENARAFHGQTLPRDFLLPVAEGLVAGQRFTPVDSVGIHVPAFTAPLPSSLIMAAVPAQAAGVKRIAVATPPDKRGRPQAGILAAAALLGLDEIYRIAGAQAIAAFAYGTSSIQRVDKVIGAGNIYVALAKAMVFGVVGIDGFYGPSEVVVVADESADPTIAASELLAQAEHSSDALSVLVSWSAKLVRAVRAELEAWAKRSKQPASRRVRESVAARAALVQTRDEGEATEVVNAFAPEHLVLMVADPAALLEKVRHAGCILMGQSSPVAVSDYAAGPSHLLPTGRTARFSSGLGVIDFMKRSSVVSVSPAWLRRFGPVVETLARMEGLPEHARSISLRLRAYRKRS